MGKRMSAGGSDKPGARRIFLEGPALEREREFLFWLCQAPWLGAVSIRKIGEAAGSFEKAYYMEGEELKERGIFRGSQSAARYEEWKKEFSAQREAYYGLSERGIWFVTPLDREYPERLLHIYDYPMGLYVKGRLPDSQRPAVAVVGARSCSSYGGRAAGRMARELAEAGVQIISGLALGIDGEAHRGALEGGGETFAVLGCGVEICYPKSHGHLFERILERGGVISEYPPVEQPLSWHFPVRNRIISALSDAVLVMEAREKSGSLITAETGLEQGKEIFALPGRITDPLSRGCNQLIQDGANLLVSSAQVLEAMGIFREKMEVSGRKEHKGLAKIEKMVYSCLDSEPRHPEVIAAAAGLSVSQTMGILLELELAGWAVRTDGLYYGRGEAEEV